MRMTAANKAKIEALVGIGYTKDAALAVVYPKKAKPEALVPEPAAEPTPVDILVANGFTPEEAAALAGQAPMVEPTAPTPDEVRSAAVVEAGFTFGKGRIYLHDALIEAAIGVVDDQFEIVPNTVGKGAVLVFKDVEKGIALQPLFAVKSV